MQGVLLVDKPAGWTSFDVVNYVRRIVADIEDKKPKNCKVGHTGTLDPFATGLLVLLIGKQYTKRAAELSKVDKTYEITATLGMVSTTGDPEGEITPYRSLERHPERSDSGVEGSVKRENRSLAEPVPSTESSSAQAPAGARDDSRVSLDDGVEGQDDREKGRQDDIVVSDTIPTPETILAALETFKGQIEQVPPAFSAIKVDGQRAYKLARAGKPVKIEPRQVTINSLEMIDYKYPELKLIANVSSGTYIRTLVEDIGKSLGTGAYTISLRRTTVGRYQIKDVIDPKNLNTETLIDGLNTF